MWEKPATLITRLGERDGTLRVEAHIYGIDVRIFGEHEYGLTVEQATVLRDRLSECLDDIANHDSITGEPIDLANTNEVRKVVTGEDFSKDGALGLTDFGFAMYDKVKVKSGYEDHLLAKKGITTSYDAKDGQHLTIRGILWSKHDQAYLADCTEFGDDIMFVNIEWLEKA